MSTDQPLRPGTPSEGKGAPRKPIAGLQSRPVIQYNKFVEQNSPDDNVSRGKIALYLALCILVPTVIYVCIASILEDNSRQAYQEMVRKEADRSRQEAIREKSPVKEPPTSPPATEYNKYADPIHKPNRKDIEDYTAQKFSGAQRKDMRDALCAVYQTC